MSPEELKKMADEAQAYANALGLGTIDFNPFDSPIVKAATQGAPTTTPPILPPAPAPSSGTFSGVLTKPLVLGFSPLEVAVGLGGIWVLFKILKPRRR